MYYERIVNYVKKFVGRIHFEIACKYLRRMKKLGGNEQVEKLIEMLQMRYAQEKAFLDELSKV
jgi:predicted PP-loop superfamily ATPase